MGDLGYWDAEGHRFSPRGVSPSSAPTSTRRTRAERPSRTVVRQLLALLDV